jgi:hypothetical protein
MQRVYKETMNLLNNTRPEVIYFAVGCSMGHYNNISPANNQQNPKFMQKFDGKKKFYIFMDPTLENPLKLESEVNLIINYTNNDSKNIMQDFVVLENNEYHVVAINRPFYFYDNINVPSAHNQELDQLFLYALVNYTIERNIKLFVQDYTGTDISVSYNEIASIFGKGIVFKNVLFDVTQNDGGCFIDFNKYPVFYDDEDNFMQARFYSFVEMRKVNEEYYKTMLIKRLNILSWQITRYLRILKGELEPTNYDNTQIKSIINDMSMIYSINQDLTEENLSNLITLMILDAAESLEVPTDVVTYITENNFDQKIITNTVATMKNLLA